MELKKYIDAKKNGYKTRSRKGMPIRENGRSSDFVAPGFATGCELVCAYCYVARHRDFGNPLEQYNNSWEMLEIIKKHASARPIKQSNQTDPTYWTYEIGESTDCLSPKNIQLTNQYIKYFIDNIPNAKPTFATKLSNISGLIPVAPQGRARIRFSLMPEHIRKIVEPATSSIQSRINAVDKALSIGYEVHLNFSPVIAYKGWVKDYIDLFRNIDKSISQQAKDQIKAEVIFLTHNEKLHKSNNIWNKEAEDLLWTPQWQESKINLRNSKCIRYKYNKIKPELIKKFREVLNIELSYCPIRYVF